MSEQVPEGWEIKRIGELGDIVTGFTPSTTDSTYWNGEIPFISPADFNGNSYVKETNKTVTRLGASKGRLLPEQSILVTCIGSLGGIAIASEECVTNQQINAVVTNNKIDARCTYYVILHNIGELERNSGTTTIPIINKTTFSEIRLPFPPLPEQKKIASILTSVDEVIEKTQSQIDKLQDLKKGTMNELLTKGIGHTEFKDSELGRIPKSWEVRRLTEVLSVKHGFQFRDYHFSDSGIPIVKIGNLSDGETVDLSKSPSYIPRDQLSQFQNFRLSKGDALMALTGATLGKVSIYDEDIVALQNYRVGKFISKDESIFIHDFIFWTLQSAYIQKVVEDLVNEAAQPNIGKADLEIIKVPIPVFEEQSEISSVMYSIEDSLRNKKLKLHQTQSLKKSLMQDLLTGKVRVSVN